jgi:replicative DNA helicase
LRRKKMNEINNTWSNDTERAVLGTLLDGRHKSAWEILSQHVLHPGYFFGRDHQLIALVMVSLSDRGEPVSADTVIGEAQKIVFGDAIKSIQAIRLLEESGQPMGKYWKLPPAPEGTSYDDSLLVALGGFNAITDLQSAGGSIGNLERNARSIGDYYRLRKAIRLVTSTLTTLQSPKGVTELEKTGTATLEGLSSLLSGGNSRGRDLGECLESAVAAGQRFQEDSAKGLSRPASWGIPQLDALCPLRPGRLYVLSAPPGDGKTSLALQAANATAAVGGKGSVSLLSLEMSGEELSTILAARELGIAPESIRNGTHAARSRSNEIAKLIEEWKATNSIMVRDLASGGQRQTASAICAWFRQRKIVTADRQALGIVDYLGLIDGNKPGAREYDTLTHATRTLKMATLGLSVPLLLLCQLRREGRDEIKNKQGEITAKPEPRMSDLRGSGSIEQDADAILFLHFPDRKKTDTVARGRIIVAKQRGGPTGSIDVDFHLRHQVLTYAGLPEGIDTPPRESDLMMAGRPNEEEDAMFFGGSAR